MSTTALEAIDEAVPKQPNVVYLLADQLRARSLPAYGERQIATPNIDRLARESAAPRLLMG